MLRRHALYPTELRARRRGGKRNKPSSVSGGAGGEPFLWDAGRPSPRAAYPGLSRARRRGQRLAPAWPCSGWGLPCDDCYQPPGALLPHPFTLACASPRGDAIGGLLSVALSSASRRPGVTRHPALWSSDFPRPSALDGRGPHSLPSPVKQQCAREDSNPRPSDP